MKHLNLGTYINILSIFVGIISIILTIRTNPVWEVIIIALMIGLIIGLIFHKFLHWFTNQPWFIAWLSWLSINQPIIESLGRENEIYQIANRIRTGESSAIIGLFREEKVSILKTFQDKTQQQNFYGERAGELVFSYLDVAGDLPKRCTPSQFWKKALSPLKKKISHNPDWNNLRNKYKESEENQFKNESLRELIDEIGEVNKQLVLIIDRFDGILNFPQLKQTTFLAGFRTLAYRSNPLILIVTAKISLTEFRRKTEHLSPDGSAFLNFIEGFGEYILGATLTETQVDTLIQEHFSFNEKNDCQFIKEYANHHPYFLQLAANCLQHAYQNKQKDPLQTAKEEFFRMLEERLTAILKFWPDNICKAFISVAKNYDLSIFFEGELEELRKLDIIKKKDNQWQVSCPICLEWIKSKTEPELKKLCQKQNK